MRIGIDGRYVHDHFPGIGRYTYNLILGLAQIDYDTIVVIHNPRLPNSRYDMAALAGLPGIEMQATEVAPLSLAEQWALPALARKLKLDLWHAPYYIGPYRLPCPLVVTIHDAISSRYPQYLPSLAARLSYEATMRLAMAAARRVIAVSHTSEADIERFFGVSPGKIDVIPEAADPRYRPQPPEAIAEMRTRLQLPDGYVLYLGMNKPHKNVERLVEAWKMVLEFRSLGDFGTLERPAPFLVIAGRQDARYPQARQAVERLGLSSSVRFLGDIAEADVPALYSGATLFVFPSLYEGFGLPVLEAMACGAAVVCSTTPALMEVVGDAALAVDPLDAEGLAAAIARLLADAGLRQELRGRGFARAARFSWRQAAEATRTVYLAACES